MQNQKKRAHQLAQDRKQLKQNSIAAEHISATEVRAESSSPAGHSGHRKHRVGDKIAATTLFLLFLAFLLDGWELEMGSATNPGPGFWPKIILGLALLCSVLIFVFGKDKIVPKETSSHQKLFLYLVSLLLIPVLYPYIGFIIPAFLSLALLFYLDAKIGMVKTGLIAGIAVLGVYGVFGMALGLPIQPLW